MKKIITFTDISGLLEENKPQPASNFIPEWYKKMQSYVGGEKKPNGSAVSTATVKKCIPVFDAITAGYIITSPADVYVSIRDGAQVFEWSDFSLINFHPIEQAPGHPLSNEHPYAKWTNHWSIKTQPGYSTMFVQPFHRESVFTILPGIVDTDTYIAPVHFPFVMNDSNFEGFIPQGTPIAQVIPFKRDVFNMQIGDKEIIKEQAKVAIRLQSKFFDRYKNLFWHRKEYK